jgi:hypothetical protein
LLSKDDFEDLESYVTIVSFYSEDLKEKKPRIIPSEFVIKGSRVANDFAVTHIKTATESRYILDGKSMSIPVNPFEIGSSLVNDYVNAKIGYKSGNPDANEPACMPGIALFPGRLSKEDVLAKYPKELSELKNLHQSWQRAIVVMADDEYARSGRQQKTISSDQRTAASQLGLSREWIIESSQIRTKNCPACESPVSEKATKCKECGCILDKKAYEELASKGLVPSIANQLATALQQVAK